MKLLLDTHALLWFIAADPRLSVRAKSLLESDAELLISIASLWEIAIKTSIGKLTLPHRDPFDRLIIAQAIVDQMPIVSRDMYFDLYSAQRLW